MKRQSEEPMGESVPNEQGVDFRLTDELMMLKQSARDFAEAEILPQVMKYDEAQEFPMGVLQKMAGLGYLGVTVPSELGGAGLSLMHFVVVMEELSRVDPSVGLTLAAHSGLCLQHLSLFGSDEQKRRYVPDLATGTKIGS